MQVRITVPILEYGPVQWTRGQLVILPGDLAQKFIDRREVVAVPTAEQATLPALQTAVVPRTFQKPKPAASKAAAKGRRK